MADKDFKVKNRLFVNGLSQASGVVLSTNNNLDAHTNLPTQYGGTGTTTSPSAGQVLYSASGSTYAPTTLSTLLSLANDVVYAESAPPMPTVGQLWIDSDSDNEFSATYTTSEVDAALALKANLITPTFTGPVVINGTTEVQQVFEKTTVSATAATGTIDYDLLTNGGVTYFTSNASGNWTLNVRGNSSTTLNSILSIGETVNIAFMVTNGATAFIQTGFQIDGSNVTPKWQGGSAPSAGNINSIDLYSIAIIKTANATFTALEDIVRFA